MPQLRLWSTYANPDPEYFERRDADGEESEAYDEADFASDSEEDDEVLNDRIWLDQQKALIAQKGGRFRKKKASRVATGHRDTNEPELKRTSRKA